MASNLGKTTVRRRPRCGDPLKDFDHLPIELRDWLSSATLCWRPKSVHRAYERALRKNPDKTLALQKLSDIERAILRKDVLRIWGPDHPFLSPRQRNDARS